MSGSKTFLIDQNALVEFVEQRINVLRIKGHPTVVGVGVLVDDIVEVVVDGLQEQFNNREKDNG